MALFVVACGVLLMVGGAVSLLLGFDIVLTERGAAMTIGGVVALAGGVIAVGVGLALKRLHQILAVLEARAGKTVRNSAPDRPILPLAVEEPRPVEPRPMVGPAAPEAVREAPGPGAAHAPDGGSVLPGAATAGLVAGAAALGATTVFGRSRGEEGEALPPPPAASPPPAPASAIEAATPDIEADVPQPAAPLELPRDLEEELSRALAETSVSADAGGIAGEPAAPGRSFEDGLSELLGRSMFAAAVAQPPRQELAGPAGELEFVIEEAPVENMPAPAAAPQEDGEVVDPPEPVESMPTDADGGLRAVGPEGAGEDWRDAPPDAGPDDDNAHDGSPTNSLQHADEGLFDDLPDVTEEANEVLDQVPMTTPDEPADRPVEAAPPSGPVLGTYAIGGRTYRMFGDGSVEAVSEKGEIERFSSMDALRKHLAGA